MTGGGFTELWLTEYDRRQLQIQSLGQPSRNGSPVSLEQGYLHQWLMQDKHHLASLQSDAYVRATLEEMQYLDHEIVTPWLKLASRRRRFDQYAAGDWQQLRVIRAAAAALNYDVLPWHDRGSDDDWLLLTEQIPKRRHWGTFVVRCGLPHPYLVEIPRPLHERHAYEFGVSLLERPAASVLLIAGAHPDANRDGSADVTRLANKVSALNLVRQVMLRELPEWPLLIVQARAIRAPISADVVLAMDQGVVTLRRLPATRRSSAPATQERRPANHDGRRFC